MNNNNILNGPGVRAEENSIAIGEITVSGDVEHIHFGHSIGYTAEQVSVLINQISSTFQTKPFDGRCPYKGLNVFNEEDAEFFFGREKLVEDLVSRVEKSRTIFITGPSGSGKSSLARAGLIPALKRGAVQNLHSERWLYETMKPGRDPIAELARVTSALVGSTNAGDEICTKGLTDATLFARWCEIALKDNQEKRVVLFIDQFEEVFTQIGKEERRLAFLNLLTYAATVEKGRVIILFSMRSDFVPNCATYSELNKLLGQQFIQIGSMQPQELVNAIAQPALRAGLKIDPDLIAQIINDMKGEPGALPLMSFALKDLFDAEQAKSGIIALAVDDYFKRGGIQKSLERHADKTFTSLGIREQELARYIFKPLIATGLVTKDTKRTALFSELVPANAKVEEVEVIVRKLADARLITTDELAGKNMVTISHEKLIEAWPWLKKLVDENRDIIALQNEIANDAKEWDDHKRDVSYLYTGGRLMSVREQLHANKLILSGISNEFIQRGYKKQFQGQLARILSIATIVALVIGGTLVFAYTAQTNERAQAEIANTAQASEKRAQRESQIAVAKEAAALAQTKFEFNPQLGLLLALESNNVLLKNGVSTNLAESALRADLAQMNMNSQVLYQHENVNFVNISSDGHWLASIGYDGTVRTLNLQSYDLQKPQKTQPTILLEPNGRAYFSSAISPNGKWLAAGTGNNTVMVYSVQNLNGASPRNLTCGNSNRQDTYTNLPDTYTYEGVTAVAFSPDSRWLVADHYYYETSDRSLRNDFCIWDIQNWSKKSEVQADVGIISKISFIKNGNSLATYNELSNEVQVNLWTVPKLNFTEQFLIEGSPSKGTPAAFSPDGHWMAYVDQNKWTVDLVDISIFPPSVKKLKGNKGQVQSVAFSPDGKWLASGGFDRIIHIWNVQNTTDEADIQLHGHDGTITDLNFIDDHTLISSSTDNSVRIWNIQGISYEPVKLIGHKAVINALKFTPDDSKLVSASDDGTIRSWNWRSPTVPPQILKNNGLPALSIDVSHDGRWIAVGSEFGNITLWDDQNLSTPPIELKYNDGDIILIAISADQHWLAAGNSNDQVILWDLTLPTKAPLIRDLAGKALFGVYFAQNGNFLHICFRDMFYQIDMSDSSFTPNLVTSFYIDPDDQYAFQSLDGHWQASAVGDVHFQVKLKDLTKNEKLPTPFETLEELSWEFSPDSHWFSIGIDDKSVWVWNMSELDPMNPVILRAHQFAISSLAFSNNGKWLATADIDGNVLVWDLDTQSVIQKGCQRVGRNFTRNEWKQYFSDEPYRATCPQWPLEPEATPTSGGND